MTNLILFDTDARTHLLPLTATRPIAELRLGALTLREKWEHRLRATASFITQDYLQGKYPIQIGEDNLIINATVLPTNELCRRVEALGMHEALLYKGDLVAARLTEGQIEHLIESEAVSELNGIELSEQLDIQYITHLWQLTRYNEQALEDDFELLTTGKKSNPISATNKVLHPEKVFLAADVQMECCILNATNGPIYIGKGAEVMEGSILRGPLYIGDGAIIKLGAKIYGGTTIGPGCRAGGEITRSIMMANSNKGHEGYLGDSVLGEWCNIGADTNTSNLKNNYSEVKLWDYAAERFTPTGQQFCGLFMGDHSKCGINTMFNTGTVVGVSANVYGADYPRNFVPDFAWGGPSGYRTYRLKDVVDTARAVMTRRHQTFSEADEAILSHIFEETARFRTWEK